MPHQLTPDLQSALSDLRWHWEDAYEIVWSDKLEAFTASPRWLLNPGFIRADDPWSLRMMIREHYRLVGPRPIDHEDLDDKPR